MMDGMVQRGTILIIIGCSCSLWDEFFNIISAMSYISIEEMLYHDNYPYRFMAQPHTQIVCVKA